MNSSEVHPIEYARADIASITFFQCSIEYIFRMINLDNKKEKKGYNSFLWDTWHKIFYLQSFYVIIFV